jgi:2,4-dienoyl-CoA reductase-like NADH-dependent reductase (Old Yellow Enzyme family)
MREKRLLTFQPGKIGNLTIKNRLVRSATFERMATDDGYVTEDIVELYKNLAGGGVGLIITGHTAVHPRGYSNPKMMRITGDDYIKGLRAVTSAVHKTADDCRIFLQLSHAGRQQVLPEFGDWAVAPSPVFDVLFQRTPRELKSEEIEEIAECFGEGVRRAKEAGFDGVQLHAAHGWLLSSFLSPRTNKRDDIWGGTTEKRAKLLLEILNRARQKVGLSFPLIVKMNTEDYLQGGMDLAEATRVAAILSKAGFAALETSGGMWETMIQKEKDLGWKPLPIPEARVGIKKKDQEAYFRTNAKEIKKVVQIPLILVGGIRSLSTVESILTEDGIDFCAMARPLIREPDLPSKWFQGKGRKKASCVSCNKCLPRPDRTLECRAGEKAGPSVLDNIPYFKKREVNG